MFTTEEIKRLASENKMYKFYTSRTWRKVASQVRKQQHNECQICKAEGRYTKANVVHHVNHIRIRPDLAYSKTYIDKNSNERPQLVCLCHKCHDMVHGKKNFNKKQKGFINKEKW